MNKSELVARLADRLGGDRAMATTALNGVLEEIQGSVASGERVSLTGFGTFDRRERAARTGRNPRTGAAIQVAASVAPVFRPGTGFRSLLSPNGHSPAGEAAAAPAPAAVTEGTEKKSGKSAKKAAKKAEKDAAKTSGRHGKKTAKKGR